MGTSPDGYLEPAVALGERIGFPGGTGQEDGDIAPGRDIAREEAFGEPLHLDALHRLAGVRPHDPAPGHGLGRLHERIVAVEVAHDGDLRCIHAAAGLDQFAELRLLDEPGDERNLVPERLAVVLLQVSRFAPGAGADAGFHRIGREIPLGRAEPALGGFEIDCRVIEEIEPGIAEDRNR